MLDSGLAILSDAGRDNEDISPTVYPNATGDILRAISEYPLSGKSVHCIEVLLHGWRLFYCMRKQ